MILQTMPPSAKNTKQQQRPATRRAETQHNAPPQPQPQAQPAMVQKRIMNQLLTALQLARNDSSWTMEKTDNLADEVLQIFVRISQTIKSLCRLTCPRTSTVSVPSTLPSPPPFNPINPGRA